MTASAPFANFPALARGAFAPPWPITRHSLRLGADFGFTDDEKTDTRAMAVQRRAQRAKELEELEAYRKEWDSHMT